MKQPLCGRADLLLALMSERSESAGFMANFLELEHRVEKNRSSSKGGAASRSKEEKALPTTQVKDEMRRFPDIPFWRVERCDYFDDSSAEEIASPERGKFKSSWVASAEKAEPALAHWRDVEPYMHRLLAAVSAPGRIHIRKTVARLSRAEILAHLPRRSRRGWGHNVQVIVDRSTAMTPYWQDQVNICANLERLFPRNAVQYADYWEGYREPILSGEHRQAGGYQLPAAGSLVIVLGDLGLLASAKERAKWRRLGRRLQHNQCRALALVPLAVTSNDNGLQSYWRIIPWERGAAHPVDSSALNAQVERLLVLLSPATRIERGFLRQLRRLTGADAAAEAAVWRHPALIGKSSVAATLDPKRIHQLRTRFEEEEDETTRIAVLRLLRQWRTHLRPEIWYEEILSLNPADHRLLPEPNEVEEAYGFFNDLGRRLYAGENIGGVARWFRNVEQRLPSNVWRDEKVKPALYRMWASTHRGDPNATPPPGYAPRLSQHTANNPLRTYQLYQFEDRLNIIDAPPPAGHASEDGRGSWLGQLTSRSGEIALLPLPSKRDDFWLSGQAPEWASDWDEDEHGRWAEFSLDHEGGTVTQRLRWIAPGTFLMGSPDDEAERYEDEGPQHEVTLTTGYWLFDTAVTQALWLAVMGKNPSRFKDPDRPVENVSWDDCRLFMQILNTLKPGLDLTLPSEAQWEYACRAGTRTPFSFGAAITPELANYNGNYPYAGGEKGQYRQEAVAVKRYQPNPWGLYQMHGNVDEWCLDRARDYSQDKVTDPLGPTERGALHVVRGGSWGDEARALRGKRRPAADRTGGAGRVVLSPEVTSAQFAWPKQSDFALRSDRGELVFRQMNRPQWASIMGRDRLGLWAGIELAGRGGPVRQRLRWIPPGRFMMGSLAREHRGLAKKESEKKWFEAEGPQHPVIISQGFWLFDTPVTQALWEAVMNGNPSEFQSSKRPVESVSWDEANEFIKNLNSKIAGLNLTLPTEAQWEYACRATTETSTYNGELEIKGANNGPLLHDIAWYGGNSGVDFDLENSFTSSDWPEKQFDHNKAGTREVALKRPNGWGLYDMLGNVWEWCRDGQRSYEDKEEVDPLGSLDEGAKRVVRGGSWLGNARRLRAAYRFALDPGDRDDILGFRCARVQEPAVTEPRGGQGSARARRPDRGEVE